MRRKGALLCAAAFTLLAASACAGGGGETTTGGGYNVDDHASLPAVRLSSFQTLEEREECTVKMRSPFTDAYKVAFSRSSVKLVEFYDEEGNLLVSSSENFEISLQEGQIVYVRITPAASLIRVTVESKNHRALLPFEVGNVPDASKIPTSSSDPADPLKPAKISYEKRPDTLYVYCNAPENLTEGPQVVNKCITRQPLENQSVFFTMEQQSDKMDPGVFYGYRVRNTGTEDMYVTIRNIGYQQYGSGAYFGEQEWTQFYNLKFKIPDLSTFTPSQLASWKALMDFGGKTVLSYFAPITYRVPAGKFIYVFGGTSQDAYANANVGMTADKRVNGNCQNGAVLFDVVGKAEGSYYVYDDPAKIAPGTEGGDAHMGVNDPEKYGVVHCGEDVGYVVDNSASWIFNDATPEGKLPVTFDNYYSDDLFPEDAPAGFQPTGEPGAEIPSTKHTQTAEQWVTHINVQSSHEAVGTDMTSFHTVYGPEQKPVTVGCGWFDTRGKLANIGNWMKDYQDVFTFTNQGESEREVTVNINLNGGLVTFVRNIDGTVRPGTEYFACERGDEGFGDAFEKAFHYTVKVPAHTTVQFIVEYNLMANSTGYVRHSVDLT